MVRQPANSVTLSTGVEIARDALVVAKADMAGRLIYVSPGFCDALGGTAQQLMGQDLATMRHEQMPLAVQALMWERLHCHREFVGVWIGRRLCGEPFWTLGHVSPIVDRASGALRGLHWVQRWVSYNARDEVLAVYRQVAAREAEMTSPSAASLAGRELLDSLLSSLGTTYDEWLMTLLARCGDV